MVYSQGKAVVRLEESTFPTRRHLLTWQQLNSAES